jgi:signal transduction histidine kinase
LFRAEGWSAVVAMAVVAVAVQPVRERLHALANQLVFGQRLSPREAMRTLAVRLDQAASADELSELTAVVVAGTRCSAAEMWLIMGDHLLLAAAAPAATPAQPVATRRTRPLAAATLGACHAVTGADLCVPVTHEGQLLAVLALRLPAGVALPKAESRLIGELAGHAGLLVANARLTESLARQVEVVTARTAELRRSRLQVVAAQDDERRRLERDIHDGAQQELVALLIHIRALRRRPADHDPTETFAPLRQAVADTRATLAHLCTGSPPAVLTAGGLAAALAAAAAPVRRAGLDVELVDTLHRRLSADIESALYFCALEAMQNASKHARASRVTVRLEFHDDDVVLSVADDGAGFDPARSPAGSGLSNMVDRLAVLGGSAWIESAPDAGVRLSCRVPLAPARAGAVG